MSTPSGVDLTTIELLVLYEAGGDNDTGIAYGVVQLHAVFEREEELLDATRSALLRLFDLGLARFVAAVPDVGYTPKRHDLPALSRDQLLKGGPGEGTRSSASAHAPRRDEVPPPTVSGGFDFGVGLVLAVPADETAAIA